jgi:ubiquinol-cytochrome c reductase cytochrome b subunit
MNKLLAWLDDRTGYRGLVHEALYERIPGGARWRYVWGSSLVFCFFVQVITGIFLWMAYSPSAQTAWESVYYIQFEMDGGWLLRGIHHYTAQLMVVLLALHLLQVVIDGAYRAPREVNFWLGLILMLIVLGLALTGYLLPWDQKGYWATQVATKIAGIVPLVGPWLQQTIVGGKEYGHHTLTRFFALHAGVLPGLLIAFLVLHLALFRKHGLKAKEPLKKPETTFWPEQVLRDGVACLAVLVTVVLLSIFARAELGAPADPADSYDAARPEWYFLFLFQFLKFFHGETGELVGAIVIPGVLMLLLFLMPLIGRSRVGHWANIFFIFLVICGTAMLTGMAIYEDHHAKWTASSAEERFEPVRKMLEAIDADLRKNGANSIYSGKNEAERVEAYAQANDADAEKLALELYIYLAYRKSQDHIAASELAEHNAERSHELAATGIPPQGALKLVHDDPMLQGPRLFAKHCASCHDHVDTEGHGIREPRPLVYAPDPDNANQPKLVPGGAPNLFGFASREWLAGLLDPKKIAAAHEDKDKWLVTDAPYFGNTAHRNGDMVNFVRDNLGGLDAEGQANLGKVIAALSAEASLPAQKELDAAAAKDGTLEAGSKALAEYAWAGGSTCIDCHKFHGNGDLGSAPDLTGYGSRQWLIEFIGNPAHARFYEGEKNDRMPAFAVDTEKPRNNLLTRKELELVVDWLRGDWYRPGEE